MIENGISIVMANHKMETIRIGICQQSIQSLQQADRTTRKVDGHDGRDQPITITSLGHSPTTTLALTAI